MMLNISISPALQSPHCVWLAGGFQLKFLRRKYCVGPGPVPRSRCHIQAGIAMIAMPCSLSSLRLCQLLSSLRADRPPLYCRLRTTSHLPPSTQPCPHTAAGKTNWRNNRNKVTQSLPSLSPSRESPCCNSLSFRR